MFSVKKLRVDRTSLKAPRASVAYAEQRAISGQLVNSTMGPRTVFLASFFGAKKRQKMTKRAPGVFGQKIEG